MLSTLCVKENGGKKESCEDSIFVKEVNNSYIVGCIADGCSTGIKSVFASNALTYLWEKYCDMSEPIHDFKMGCMLDDLRALAELLEVGSMNLLSTFIPFYYSKVSRKLRIRPFGDGFYSVNGKETTLEQNNTPDYLGYQVGKTYADHILYLDKYPELVFEDVDSFIIGSDGIDSLQQNQFVQLDCTQNPKEFLLSSPDSSNCLQRRYNILKRNKVINSDDMSIISYVKD